MENICPQENIVIEKLSKAYGDNTVITQMDLEIQAGKISCIMGESGIGKTTLLKILMGLETSDRGHLYGIDINTKISAVFQEARLCDNLTAIGNVSMVCNKNVSKENIISQLESILPRNSLGKKVGLLSGGMRQRVAIVRAFIADSDIILMDEPFNGLDEETKKQVVLYVKNNQRGRTVLFVTHNIEDAQMLEAPILCIDKAVTSCYN